MGVGFGDGRWCLEQGGLRLFLWGGYLFEWGVLAFVTGRFGLNGDGWSFKVRELPFLAYPQLPLPDACRYGVQGRDICT